jgi:hypothetical protein
MDGGNRTDTDPCIAGSLEEILGCRRQSCSTQVRDASPSSLVRLGWRAIVCDQAPPEGATSTEQKGTVWLYQQSENSLHLVTLVTSIGASAKYYKKEAFTVVDAKAHATSSRQVDAITWRLSTGSMTCYGYGTCAFSNTFATYCLDGACRLTLPLDSKAKLTPAPGTNASEVASRLNYEVHFSHRVTDNGVDVRMLSAEPASIRQEQEQYVGHHPF